MISNSEDYKLNTYHHKNLQIYNRKDLHIAVFVVIYGLFKDVLAQTI
jgi:hypothetical protein